MHDFEQAPPIETAGSRDVFARIAGEFAEGIKRMGIFISDFGVTLADACQRLSDAMAAAITSYPDWPHRHHAACWLKCDAGRPE